MVTIMYSKNDYRYYLQARLAHSDDFLAHYGVLGMKWGVRNDNRIASYREKQSSNQQKINEYTAKLNTVGAKNRAAKAAKYQAKLSKLEKKASKARAKLAKGKTISKGQAKKIAKAEKYRAKVAKNSVKNDKYQSKITKLEKKNAKLDKNIHKIETSQKIKSEKNVYKNVRKGINQATKNDTKKYLSGKIGDKDYSDLMDTYAGMHVANKKLYKVEKAKIKNPQNYDSSYKITTDYFKANGSTADDYITTKTDRKGNVKSVSPVWSKGPMVTVNGELATVKKFQDAERKKKK